MDSASPSRPDIEPELAEIRSLLTRALFREALERAGALAAAAPPASAERAQGELLRARALRNLSRYRDAEAAYQEAGRAFEASGDPGGRADAMSGLALARWHFGDYAGAAAAQIEALSHYEKAGDRRGLANSCNTLGLVSWKSEDPARAVPYFDRALAIYEELSHGQGIAASLTNLGGVQENLGDMARSADYHREALRQYRTIGDRAGEANAMSNLAFALQSIGLLEECGPLLEGSLALNGEIGNWSGFFRALSILGILDVREGRLREGAGRTARAAHGAKLLGDQELEANAVSDLVGVLPRLGLHSRLPAWYGRLLRLKESLLSVSRDREIQRLSILHETESARRDASDAMRRREELEREVFARDRLLSILTHDFRGGIGFLSESLDGLAFGGTRAGGDGEEGPFYRLAVTAHRLQESFEGLLAWAKGSLRGIKPVLSAVKAGRILEDVLTVEAARIRAAGLSVGSLLDGLEVAADPHMLRIVFSNLVSNAVKHLGPGGRAVFRGGRSRSGVPCVEYGDSGTGTGARALEALASGTAGGDGLGLLLCREFMEIMGGSIETDGGSGTVLRLVFPPARPSGDGEARCDGA